MVYIFFSFLFFPSSSSLACCLIVVVVARFFVFVFWGIPIDYDVWGGGGGDHY